MLATYKQSIRIHYFKFSNSSRQALEQASTLQAYLISAHVWLIRVMQKLNNADSIHICFRTESSKQGFLILLCYSLNLKTIKR